MKNPLLQAERQHKLMEQLLADAKQACPVHSFVYFANKNARVGVRDARIYTDETSLRRAIQSAPEPGRPVDAARLAALLEPANSIFCAFPYLGRPAAHFEPRGFLVEKQR